MLTLFALSYSSVPTQVAAPFVRKGVSAIVTRNPDNERYGLFLVSLVSHFVFYYFKPNLFLRSFFLFITCGNTDHAARETASKLQGLGLTDFKSGGAEVKDSKPPAESAKKKLKNRLSLDIHNLPSHAEKREEFF